eukprot:352223-Chlamydomonas_euryale.AAC.20
MCVGLLKPPACHLQPATLPSPFRSFPRRLFPRPPANPAAACDDARRRLPSGICIKVAVNPGCAGSGGGGGGAAAKGATDASIDGGTDATWCRAQQQQQQRGSR